MLIAKSVQINVEYFNKIFVKIVFTIIVQKLKLVIFINMFILQNNFIIIIQSINLNTFELIELAHLIRYFLLSMEKTHLINYNI